MSEGNKIAPGATPSNAEDGGGAEQIDALLKRDGYYGDTFDAMLETFGGAGGMSPFGA